MRSTNRVVTVVATLLLAATGALGAAVPAWAAPAYPAPVGRCVDEVGVLGPDLCAKVTAVLLRDEKASTDEIGVAVVHSTGQTSIETWSTGLFNSWGVGKRGRNNGVLLVVAVDDRRVRLATGRGMAARLSDESAGAIVDSVITPHFADQQYALGILAGLDEVRRRIGHPVGQQARLEVLAAQAPDAAQASSGPASDDATADGGPVGESLVSGDGFAEDADEDLPFWPIAVFVLAGIGLLAVFARGVSGSTSHDDRHGWASSGSDTTSGVHSWMTSSDSSGGSTTSGYDGGSSGGSGASGSW